MFRLNKQQQQRSEKSGELFDFHFTRLQALQVPKGWDKLFVSIISQETGKTLIKSGKVLVRNGSCQWTESLSKSIWISQHDPSKENDECCVKLVVSMGSPRSRTLGEATVNLGSHKNSKSAVPVSLPLQNCTHGTILKVNIQCLARRPELREGCEDTGLFREDSTVDYEDAENKSDGSFGRSIGSSSSNHLDITSHTDDLNRNTSLSASGPRYSFGSMDDSWGRKTYSTHSNLSGIINNNIQRQDSTGSQSSSCGSYSSNDSAWSNHYSFNSKVSTSQSHLLNTRDEFNCVSRTAASSPLRNSGSSRDLLEAAEVTIKELREQASMGEQNACKMMSDVERLKKELSDQSKHRASLEIELSESHRECDYLKQEVKQLNVLLEESRVKQPISENLKLQAEEIDGCQKELEGELKFQIESNANLALQLKKAQESNLELVSILQELEDTIEKQKIEIANMSDTPSGSKDARKYSCSFENNEEMKQNKQVVSENMNCAPCVSDLEVIAVQHKLDDLPTISEAGESQWQESPEKAANIIKYLEKSLEEKIYELEVERSLRTQTLAELEAEWRDILATKEEEISNLEIRLSEALGALGSENNGNLIKEIGVLRQKIEELETDCNELTDENLELLLKLKESKLELPEYYASSNSSSGECKRNGSLYICESEVSRRKSCGCKHEEELKLKETIVEEFSSDHLQIQCIDLGKKCADLELQLQAFKEKSSYLDGDLCKCCAKLREQEAEIAALQQRLKQTQAMETELVDCHTAIHKEPNISESHATVRMALTLSNLHEQVQLCINNVKKQQFTPGFPNIAELDYSSCESQISNDANLLDLKEQAEAILKSFLQLKDLFEAKIAAFDGELRQNQEARPQMANMVNIQNKLGDHDSRGKTFSISYPKLESLETKAWVKVAYPVEGLLKEMSEIEKLNSDILLREQEVRTPSDCQRELETQNSSLQNEKKQLEEKMEAMQREGPMTSKCLDDLPNEMMVLNSSFNSQVSANKVLERKSTELPGGKKELEIRLSELEKENIELSERICGLEAQLRYLTDEKESSRLELQNSESCAVNFREQIRRLETEMEAQKTDTKHKMQDMQKRWLAAQEESDILKTANAKLQTTAEYLIEDCSSLQKSNIEFRNQKGELHERCTILEAELKESEKVFSEMIKKVKVLEEKHTTLLEEIASKEMAINLELDTLLQENKQIKEKLVMEESLQRQMYMEKLAEVEYLQRQVAQLSEQTSSIQDGKAEKPPDAVLEVSRLYAKNAFLEASLQDVQGKLNLSENNLSSMQMELEAKLLAFMDELASSKRNQEVLMADNEKLLELLEDVKSNEEKQKSVVRELELKLKASEYGRLQATEEIASLKVQLQKTVLLQDEILALKRSLNEVKFEKERLEASFQILSTDYEALSVEKVRSEQKISDMQVSVSQLEEYKHSKVALQEKVLRLEGDLTAREALSAVDSELKNELARAKMANNEFQKKIRHLEEENQEHQRRSRAFEEELKQHNEEKQYGHKSSFSTFSICPETNTTSTSTSYESNLIQVIPKPICSTGNSVDREIEPFLKIQQLETELAEALEANDLYKAQLKSLLSWGRKDQSSIPRNLMDEDKPYKRDGDLHQASLLEELKDLQERYFHMSLKYAEVEAEREQLVLKLKSISNGRRSFA